MGGASDDTALIALASTSPRRAELLLQLGLPFRVLPPSDDEQSGVPPHPAEAVRFLAERKLRSVFPALGSLRWALACDTLLESDGRIIGKPTDRTDARATLLALTSRTHRVHTGIALADPNRIVRLEVATTEVTFRSMSNGEIERYLDTGEWQGVAGGYRIQETGSLLVASLTGEYSNVVGLPLSTLYGILRNSRYPLFAD
jgi:septum formation protein